MFAKVNAPFSMLSEELDVYLSKGWFRMGQSVFTTNFLNFKSQFYSAIWLRIDLKDYLPDSTFLKLKKLNSSFKIQIGSYTLNQEKEELFAKYRKSVAFDASDSLQSQLFGNSTNIDSVFDTHEVCIYEGDKLIAAGFFDIGNDTAAGISSFYDPEYKKNSLGKYIIYLKIAYCTKLGLNYFYPGYFVPGYEAFNYKLDINRKALQFLSLVNDKWLAISNYSEDYNLFQEIDAKLKLLQVELALQNVKSQLFNYEYFQSNMVHELTKYDLFDYPIFLYCFDLGNRQIKPILVYDILDKEYKLLECRSVWETFEPNEKPDTFSTHLLKIDQVFFTTNQASIMAKKLN